MSDTKMREVTEEKQVLKKALEKLPPFSLARSIPARRHAVHRPAYHGQTFLSYGLGETNYKEDDVADFNLILNSDWTTVRGRE